MPAAERIEEEHVEAEQPVAQQPELLNVIDENSNGRNSDNSADGPDQERGIVHEHGPDEAQAWPDAV